MEYQSLETGEDQLGRGPERKQTERQDMKRLITVALIATAGAVFAHEGVNDPAVKARMESMKSMGDATKVLVEMARGQAAFDAARAEAARVDLLEEASHTTALFEARATDPMTEAKDSIWAEFSDFTAKAQMLSDVVAGADLASPEALRLSVGEIGRACTACHDAYRE